MLRLRLGTRFLAASKRVRRQSSAVPLSQGSSASASEAATNGKFELYKVCVISVAGLGSVFVIAQTAKDIAKISKSGSAEEQETLKKTE